MRDVDKSKVNVVFLFSLLAIGLLIGSALLALAFCVKAVGLLAGILLMILAVPFHIWGKRNPVGYGIGFAINSVANGFVVSAYYLVKNITIGFSEMTVAVLPAIAVMLLAYFMFQRFHKTKKFSVSVTFIVNIILLAAEIILWIQSGSVPFSFGFFSLMISMFYLGVLGITINHNERPVLRDISFGSFGLFILLTIVVLTILSEGDAVDALDFDFFGDDRKKQKGKIM